jgi:hypothetical protein
VDYTLLLVDLNRFRYPFFQLQGVDETGFDKFLYFSLYRHCFARIDQAKLLSDRFDLRISRDLMLNNTSIISWHLLIRPGKTTPELFKQFSVDFNLFRREICTDEDSFHDARSFGDIDRNCFNNTFHVSLGIYFMCSQRVNRTRGISIHGHNKLSCLYSLELE